MIDVCLWNMSLEVELVLLAYVVQGRLIELLLAPLNNQDMLWTAVPLLIATLFITLYFGRNRWEELGWNTAFGNTMVFLFVAMDIIRTMYNYGGSWESVIGNKLYLLLSLGLAGASVLLMLITYFHMLPKRLAFFLFSAPPINVSVYVVMTMVYANVVPDYITALAGVAFLAVILIVGILLKFIVRTIGLAEPDPETAEEEVEELAEKVDKERVRQKKKKKSD
jgi:hypothetical protein